ncbi:hypothetical protein QEN19_002173 [Hanseniaspora menglaensis]
MNFSNKSYKNNSGFNFLHINRNFSVLRTPLRVQSKKIINTPIKSIFIKEQKHNSTANGPIYTMKHSKKKKGLFFMASLFLLLLSFIFSNSTLILQAFFKSNNILFSDDINSKFLLNYIENNFGLYGVKLSGDESIKLDWSNGWIEVNDIDMVLDKDNKFLIKNLKFNINFYKYCFDKNNSTFIDDIEVNGVKGKMNTESLLTHEFDIKNKITLKDCIFKLNNKNSLKIFQLEIKKISNDSFLLDLMNCEILSGEFNDSLFTIVERQPHLINGKILQLNKDMKNSWEKTSRLQMNKINLNKLHNEAFDWIYDGEIEFVVDLMIPKQIMENDKHVDTTSSTNSSYLVMDLSMKLYNPRCRVSGDHSYQNISHDQIKLIAESLNKHLPKQVHPIHSGMHIYNETISSPDAGFYVEENKNDDILLENKSNINLSSAVYSTDYIVPLNCKLLIDPSEFKLKEVCERITDEFYMELSRIAMLEETGNINSNKKWETVMLGLLSQILIVGLGTFN